MPLNLNDDSTWVTAQLPIPASENSGLYIPYWVLADLDVYYEEFNDNANLTRTLIAVDWNKRNIFRKYALGYTTSYGTNQQRFKRYIPLRNPYQTNQYLISLRKHAVHSGLSKGDWSNPSPANDFKAGVPLWFYPDASPGTCPTTPHPDNPTLLYPAGWWKMKAPSEIFPFPPTGGMPPRIIYEAVFSTLQYEVVDEATMTANLGGLKELARYVIREQTIRARERRLPSFGYETGDGSATPIPEVGFIPFTEGEFTYTWCKIPLKWIPWTAIANCSLKINDAIFDYKPRDDSASPAETWVEGRYKIGDILFKGLANQIRPYRDPTGQFVVDLAYLFAHQPADGLGNGHLKVPVTATTNALRWVKVRERGSVASPKYLYSAASLDTLFRPEPTP